MKLYSAIEKLLVIERLIDRVRDADESLMMTPGPSEIDILKAICADLRATMSGVPSEALSSLQARVADAAATKGAGGFGFELKALAGIGQEVIGRWPVLRQALERYGNAIEAAK